jgi:hypothetical protein
MSDTKSAHTQDWMEFARGASKGASEASSGINRYAQTKSEAKESERRTKAGLFSKAQKRKLDKFKESQEYGGEMADIKHQSMRDTARGMVEALSGSTDAARNLYLARSKKQF